MRSQFGKVSLISFQVKVYKCLSTPFIGGGVTQVLIKKKAKVHEPKKYIELIKLLESSLTRFKAWETIHSN